MVIITLNTIFFFVGMLLIHWIADFVLQSDWEAKNKSTNNRALTSHVMTYAGFWVIPAVLVLGIYHGVLFAMITFWCHYITDYFTSRWNKKSFDKGDYHTGFVKIGLDQVLHYIQLLITYYILIN